MVVLISKENLKKVAELHRQIKELEAQFEVYKDQLKEELISAGVNKLEAEGVSITLVETSRTTIAKDAVDRLWGKGLTDCLLTKVEVNVETLKRRVGRGLTEQEFHSMVKETPYYRMTIK